MRLYNDKHKEGMEIESFSTPVLNKIKFICIPLVDEVVVATWIRHGCKQSSKPMAEICGQRTGQNTDFKFHISR